MSSSATPARDFSLVTSPGEPALRRVVLQQVGEVVGRDEVVDGDDVDRLAEQALFANGPKHEPADAPEPVDADFDHEVGLIYSAFGKSEALLNRGSFNASTIHCRSRRADRRDDAFALG